MKKIFLLLLLLTMPACTPIGKVLNPYEENFKCKAKDSTGKCVDTTTAYMEARHSFSSSNGLLGKPAKVKELQEDVDGKRYKTISELLVEEKAPILKPPKIVRVLFLPYKGVKDELFMSRYVYFKLEDSSWILTDIAEEK